MSMLRNIAAIAILLLLSLQDLAGQGQQLRMRPADRLLVEFMADYWQNVPGAMRLHLVNRGASASIMHDMPLGFSRFSLAGGLSFHSHNLYADHLYRQGNGVFDFFPILQEFRNSKLNLNYLGVPVEFRFRGADRERGLRIFTGISADFLVSAHNKYRGLDPAGSREIKVKQHKLGQIRTFRLQAYGRIGIGNWSAVVRFPLTKIFYDNSASEMVPVSLGITRSIY